MTNVSTVGYKCPQDYASNCNAESASALGKFSNPRFIRTVVDGKLKEKGIEWSGLLNRLREKAGRELRWNQMPGVRILIRTSLALAGL